MINAFVQEKKHRKYLFFFLSIITVTCPLKLHVRKLENSWRKSAQHGENRNMKPLSQHAALKKVNQPQNGNV